jgi:hypothetical protein
MSSVGIGKRCVPPKGAIPSRRCVGNVSCMCDPYMITRQGAQNANTIQYETMRKLRSHIANFVHTCPGRISARFMGKEGAAGSVYNSPTNTEWFRRFMKGCHRGMGDIWMPDRPVTIQELLKCLDLLEDDWATFEKDGEGRLKTVNLACMLITGFCAALRGEEIIRADVGAIRKYWDEAIGWPGAEHVPLMLASEEEFTRVSHVRTPRRSAT